MTTAIVTIALAAVLLAGCASTPTIAPAARNTQAQERGFLARTAAIDGETYRYVVYVPADLDLDEPAPCIVFLNGRGECGRDGWKQVAVGLGPAIMTNPDKWPFIVVFPQKPDQATQWGQHTDMVMAALRQTQDQFPIDPSRIYLTGLSQGGHGTWAIAAAKPEVFAAIAPICGYGDPDVLAPKLVSVPVWAFHGERDDVVLPDQSRRMVEAIRARGASPEPKLTMFPLANHNSWDPAYRDEDIASWFLQHRR